MLIGSGSDWSLLKPTQIHECAAAFGWASSQCKELLLLSPLDLCDGAAEVIQPVVHSYSPVSQNSSTQTFVTHKMPLQNFMDVISSPSPHLQCIELKRSRRFLRLTHVFL